MAEHWADQMRERGWSDDLVNAVKDVSARVAAGVVDGGATDHWETVDGQSVRVTKRGCRWRQENGQDRECVACGEWQLAFDPDDYPVQ